MNENTQAVVRFLQDTVTKKWVWKLSDETGSTVAKSPVQYDTEDLAKDAFVEFQGELKEASTEVEIGLKDAELPATPEPTPEIAPEQIPVEPTPEPEATPEVPVEPTAPEAPAEEPTATVETEVPADAGTTEPAPVEDAGSVI